MKRDEFTLAGLQSPSYSAPRDRAELWLRDFPRVRTLARALDLFLR
jgi:hypothetical protein